MTTAASSLPVTFFCWQRLLVSILVASYAISTAAAAQRPNILFVFTDDHAYQSISAYGSRINQTPNMDCQRGDAI